MDAFSVRQSTAQISFVFFIHGKLFFIYLIDRESSILVLDALDSFLILHERLDTVFKFYFYVGENRENIMAR
jgi:hypothetical protein